MLDDFKRALARIQSDYGFYIDCQVSAAVALADYDLTPDERTTLSDPGKLADVLKGDIGVSRIPSITIKISGKHDWVNRAGPTQTPTDRVDLDATIATQVGAVRKASTDEERTGAVVRLMELIG